MMKGKGKKKWKKKASVDRQMEKKTYRRRRGWRVLVLFSGDVDNTLNLHLSKVVQPLNL